ncbi:AAA family ATPase [Nocardia macrotermitis]|uniref:Holliday junction ATP-dependent DNA helicase RuvB n=1 Tax=Nocardia macrotermitis TaxID=2585198 RepID=A0A7K0D4U4_9NOCA|nr:AAA family ATPase [Nocardia macrotermitis]MQY20750.1 Holliday junction ATP-dependent DNA helicase RuvB [Nocardia macrotermitis]
MAASARSGDGARDDVAVLVERLPGGQPFVAVEPVAPFLERVVRVVSWADGTRHNDADDQPNPVLLFIGAPHSGQGRLAAGVRAAMAEAEIVFGSEVLRRNGIEIAGNRDGTVAANFDAAIYKVFDLSDPAMLLIENADILFDEVNAPASLEKLIAASHDARTCSLLVLCGSATMLTTLADAAPEFVRRTLQYTLPDFTRPNAAAALVRELVRGIDVEITDPAHTRMVDYLRSNGSARAAAELIGAASQNAVAEGSTGRDARILVDAAHFAGLDTVPKPGGSGKTLSELLVQLDAMIGLEPVKQQVRDLVAEAEIDARRRAAGLSIPPRSRHLVFTGNPGTAKTTVARMISQIYRELGIISKGHLVETQRADLVSEFIAATAPQTRAVVEKALGGVLFVDEAYALSKGGEQDHGREAIDELLVQLENRRADFVVIAAGYTKEMEDFLDANPGLRSRFGKRIEFPDYSNEELAGIYVATARAQDYHLTTELVAALPDRMSRIGRGPGFANGRSARTVFEQTITNQSKRLSIGSGDLQELTLADLPDSPAGGMGPGGSGGPRRDLTELLAELDAMIGLDSVKQQVRTLATEVRVNARRKAAGLSVGARSRHMIFLGNPGTAKTTVARLIARIYRELGVVSSGHLVECSRPDLVGEYIGHTAPKTRKVIESSIGGVLFIDEAYALVADDGQRDFGGEAIAELLLQMENHRDELLVIAAGYPDQMDRFLDQNPGMRSRFGATITFEDYTDDELAGIFAATATSQGYRLADDLLAALPAHIGGIDRDSAFANGRTMRQLLERAIGRQSMRLGTDLDAVADEELQILRAVDLADG